MNRWNVATAQTLSAAPEWSKFRAQPDSHVIWRRVSPRGVASWLDRLVPEDLPDDRFLAATSNPRVAIEDAFTRWGCDDCAAANVWRQDVAALVAWFGAFTGQAFAKIRLDRVIDNGCARFHQDNVRIRALCTYRGPGSQIVPDAYRDQALADQGDYRGRLIEAPRFAVSVLKGWRCAGPYSAVHRSPPIEGVGLVRLVLCLDEADGIDAENSRTTAHFH